MTISRSNLIKMNRIYISGPMTGVPGLNKKEFDKKTKELRSLGLEVFNPAEISLKKGATWQDYMRICLENLSRSNMIVMLHGWETSRGAMLEIYIAQQLGIEITFSR